MPATLSQRPVRLLERAAGHGRVDAKAGIIYGAKLCGLQSRNIGRRINLDPDHFGPAVDKPYRYSRAGLAAAAPMYENAPLHFKHPPSSLDREGRRTIKPRVNHSPLGRVKNVRMQEDGLYGDLHINWHHPQATFVIESAQNSPNDIALSHSAVGIPMLKNGQAVIYKIEKVMSVDVVTETPATTRGLFESLGSPVFVSRKERRMADNATLEAPEAADLDAFKEKLRTILDDGQMSPEDKLTAVSAMLDYADEPVMEDYLRLKSEQRARALLESADREATPERLKVVAKIRDEKTAKALIESWPAKSESRRPLRSAPLHESHLTSGAMLTGDALRAAVLR